MMIKGSLLLSSYCKAFSGEKKLSSVCFGPKFDSFGG